MYLIFDTETTGLPNNWKAPLTDFDNWPRLVQLAWQLHDIKGGLIEKNNLIIKPDNFDIPYNSTKVHGITNEIAQKKGLNIDDVLEQFIQTLEKTNILVGHNVEFDNNIVGCEFLEKIFLIIYNQNLHLTQKLFQLSIVKFQEVEVVDLSGLH